MSGIIIKGSEKCLTKPITAKKANLARLLTIDQLRCWHNTCANTFPGKTFKT